MEEFDTSLMYDDIEKIRAREEEAEKDQNNKLSFAGMMALTAGAVLMIVGILSGMDISGSLLDFLGPAMTVVGVGSLAYGFFKTLKLAFRQKELNFPALNVYRKTRPTANSTSSTTEAGARTRTRNQARTQQGPTMASSANRSRAYQRSASSYSRTRTRSRSGRKTLTRSRTNRVFSGVAGGLAEYANISPALIRFAFIAGLIVSGGLSIFVYLLLSIILPANYDEPRGRRPSDTSSFDRPSI